MSKLTIIANIRSNADSIERVKAELLKLLPITREEAGCINFDLCQDNEDPAHFVLYENWESRELWQAHMSAPHIAAFMAATDGALAELTLSEMSHIE